MEAGLTGTPQVRKELAPPPLPSRTTTSNVLPFDQQVVVGQCDQAKKRMEMGWSVVQGRGYIGPPGGHRGCRVRMSPGIRWKNHSLDCRTSHRSSLFTERCAGRKGRDLDL